MISNGQMFFEPYALDLIFWGDAAPEKFLEDILFIFKIFLGNSNSKGECEHDFTQAYVTFFKHRFRQGFPRYSLRCFSL